MAKKPNPRTPEKERRNEAAFAKPGTGQFAPGSSQKPNPAATGQPTQSASQPITNQGATAYTQQNGKVSIQQPNVPQAPIIAPPSPKFMEAVKKAAHMDNVVPAPVQPGQTTGTVQTQQGAPGAQEPALNMTATPAEQPGLLQGAKDLFNSIGGASSDEYGNQKGTPLVDFVLQAGSVRMGVGTPGASLKASVSEEVDAMLPKAGMQTNADGFTVKAANVMKQIFGKTLFDKVIPSTGQPQTVEMVLNQNKLAAWVVVTTMAASIAQLGNVVFGMFQKNEASDSASFAVENAKKTAVAIGIQPADYNLTLQAYDVAQAVIDTEIELWNPLAGREGNAINAFAKKRQFEIGKQATLDLKRASDQGLTAQQQDDAKWAERQAQAEEITRRNNEAFLATTEKRLRMEEESAARKNAAFVKSSADASAARKEQTTHPSVEKKNAEDLKALDKYYENYDEIVAMMREETRPSNVLK